MRLIIGDKQMILNDINIEKNIWHDFGRNIMYEILEYLDPNFVCCMIDGQRVLKGKCGAIYAK